MKLLEERIRKDGIVKPGNVLKVEKFDINSSLSLGKTEFTYDTVIPNRLLSVTKDGVTKTFTYSSALPGMPISINNGIYTQTLEWSGSKLTKYDYENGKSLSFTYDSSGLRIKKVLTDNLSLGTITHNYRYSGSKLIEEYVIDDIKGDEYKLHYLYDESGKLYGFEYGTNTYYYLRDTLLNIIGIINTSGQIVCEYKYDAYGNHKVLNSNRVETTSGNFIGNINPFRYKGYYYDVETQLYWVSSRYYSPELCRWISPDSIEYLDPQSINGLNLYAYCGNDPINRFDPTGHSWESFWNGVRDWFSDHWKEVVIGTAFIVGGALVTALTAGAGVGFMAAFGSALLSSTIQVGISVGTSVLVGGLVSVANGGGFFDNVGDNIASAYMWGGIFSGGAQILGGGFRIAANKGVTTGRAGGIKLGNSGVKILSPDKNNWAKAGGTLIKFGNGFRIDTGAMWGLHMHILSSGHLPIGAVIAGFIGTEY